jgi:hypothetical protein
MSAAGDMLSFTFEYQGHGWALASMSDGAVTHCMHASYALGDPLFVLVQAVVAILRNGDEATGCVWWYEPALDRWTLQREDDSVHVTIRRRDHALPSLSLWSPAKIWLSEAGELKFTATGGIWTFAAQVRRAVNRLQPEEGDDPTWPRGTAEYWALCTSSDTETSRGS